MDGVLVVDKPSGPTSHDIVAWARRVLGERRIGHTGTLDPLATGVLPLACGRATRLVRFLMGSTKSYEATVLFGVTTDTFDVMGAETSRSGTAPTRQSLQAALETLTGDYLQVPPPYSAKKVGGKRSYVLAREDQRVELAPVMVHVSSLKLRSFFDDRCQLSITCAAGFYVRSLARDLGERCGTGACLESLKRTRSGEFTLDEAIPLDAIENASDAAGLAVPMAKLLPDFPAVVISSEGVVRASHGQPIRKADLIASDSSSLAGWVRLLDRHGALVGLGIPCEGPGVLHPEVVLI